MPITVLEHGIISRRTEGSFRYHAWGTLARMKDGTLAAACSGGRNWHICPFGKTMLFLSKDEGKTWSCPIIVNDSWMDDRDAGLVALPNGGLMLTWFTEGFDLLDQRVWKVREMIDDGEYEMMQAYRKTAIIDPENQKKGRYCRVSHDGGLTWSEPRPTPASAPHGPTVMNDGSLLYFGRCPEAIKAYRSTDEGRTWEHLGDVPQAPLTDMSNLFEPHALQLPSGRIIGMIRYVSSQKNKPAEYYPLSMFMTHSDDGGRTWSEPKYIDCHGAPPHLMRHSSGALICSYGRRDVGQRWYDPSERALISWDDGETWSEDVAIYHDAPPDWDLGYASTVELSDGSLLTAYYQKYQTEDQHLRARDEREFDSKCSFLYTRWKLTRE